MTRSDALSSAAFTLVSALLLLALVLQTLGCDAQRPQGTVTQVTGVDLRTEDGEETLSLPVSVGDLSRGSVATMMFSVDAEPGDVLYLHTVYASYRVYANDELIGEFGAAGSYPSFLSDPPSEAASYSLGGLSGTVQVRVEFTTPVSRSSLYLYPPLVGPGPDVLRSLVGQYGPALAASVVFFVIGLALSVFSLSFCRFELRGRRFRYPGMIALLSSVWQMSENTLVVYLLQRPSLLYLLAFAGMFLFTIPLVKLTMIAVDRRSSPLLRTLLAVLEASVVVAFALQLAGVVQLSQSSRFFTVLLPVVIWVLTAYSYYVGIRGKSKGALHYALAVSLLAVGSALEAVNYYVRVIGLVSGVFQAFMLAFVVAAAVLGMAVARRVYAESLRKVELDRDVQLLERSIEAQKEHNRLLLEHERDLSKLRHDMRHHYVLIRDMADGGRYDELSAYLDRLDVKPLTSPVRTYCENVVANAMVAYYAGFAEERGYRFDAKLDIPATMPHLSDGDLCVVIGNLLENAMEACAKVEGDTPQVVFRARRQGPLLFMTLDNSLGSEPRRGANGFVTSKRGGSHGIGLRSIQAIAEEHSGEAVFGVEDGMFRSSLFLEI